MFHKLRLTSFLTASSSPLPPPVLHPPLFLLSLSVSHPNMKTVNTQIVSCTFTTTCTLTPKKAIYKTVFSSLHHIPTSSTTLSFFIFNLSEKSPFSLIFPAFCFLIALCSKSNILATKLTQWRWLKYQNVYNTTWIWKLNAHVSICRCVRLCGCRSLTMRAVAGLPYAFVCEHVIACMCLRVCLCLPFDCHLNLWHVQQSYETADRQTGGRQERRWGGGGGEKEWRREENK